MFRASAAAILPLFASLLASTANANSHGLFAAEGLMMEAKARSADILGDEAIRLVESRQNSGAGVSAAAAVTAEAGGATVLSQVADFTPEEMAAWNTNTTDACTKALTRLQGKASNPSGTSVCYNLPLLETDTGKFVADLRLFQISPPSGTFANVDPSQSDQIKISMQYTSATANQVTGAGTTNQAAAGTTAGKKLRMRQDSAPVELESHFFVGKINPELMKKGLTLELLEMWTTPIITLIGTSAGANNNNNNVRTGISTNEASFVSGVFSNEVVQSDTVLAELAVQDVQRQLAEGTIAFVLPGTDILIFPVGLVITSVWMVLGFVVYGFGTYERYKHRDVYRTRKARAEKGGGRTF